MISLILYVGLFVGLIYGISWVIAQLCWKLLLSLEPVSYSLSPLVSHSPALELAQLKLYDYWNLTAYKLGITDSIQDRSLPKSSIIFGDNKKLKVNFEVSRGYELSSLRSAKERLEYFINAPAFEWVDLGDNIEVTVRANGEDSLFKTVHTWYDDLATDKLLPDYVPIGVNADEELIHVPLNQNHLLISGVTGAGKGSVIWSILAPLSGREDVELHGVDLKGGFEFLMGPQVFSTLATNQEEAANSILYVHDIMEAREEVLAGVTRKVTPSKATPLIVLMIDEAIDLTDMAKSKNGEFDEAIEAFQAILRKGRAVGVVVIAAIQSNRINDFRWSKRFTQKIGLKLDTYAQATLLGNQSLDVLELEFIPSKSQGVGMVYDEEAMRYSVFRAFYLEDGLIGSLPEALTEV